MWVLMDGTYLGPSIGWVGMCPNPIVGVHIPLCMLQVGIWACVHMVSRYEPTNVGMDGWYLPRP
jgi:hypothetical protein